MTTVIIVDDQPRAHAVLEHYIAQVDGLKLSGKFTSAMEAIDFLESNRVDIVLLDINMPEVDGFEFLHRIGRPPLAIFTTASSEFALKSYEYDAIDYLKKPIPFERFQKAIEKAMRICDGKTGRSIQDRIELRIGGEMQSIPFSEISYFQSMGNYIKVHTRGKVILTQCTTQEIERKLPSEVFIRIHKSFIVNRSKVDNKTDDEIVIGSVTLPIGKTFKRYVKNYFR